MNTEITVHPKLQHLGLVTGNLDAMIEWYGKVLGMTVNHRRNAPPAGAQGGPPFSMAFASNDEVNHRIAFFGMPGVAAKRSSCQASCGRSGLNDLAVRGRLLADQSSRR
jgi:catechol 2,3-dioxygenase